MAAHKARSAKGLLKAITRTLATVFTCRACLGYEAMVVLVPEHVETIRLYYMQPELYADLIQLFVERGTSITPTLVCYWLGGHRFSKQYEEEDRALLADPAYAFIPELDRRWIFMAYDKFGEYKMTPKYQQAYKSPYPAPLGSATGRLRPFRSVCG